jgi:hypothetical protein
VRIFIESLIKELAGTRNDQKLTLLGMAEELAVGDISGGRRKMIPKPAISHLDTRNYS